MSIKPICRTLCFHGYGALRMIDNLTTGDSFRGALASLGYQDTAAAYHEDKPLGRANEIACDTGCIRHKRLESEWCKLRNSQELGSGWSLTLCGNSRRVLNPFAYNVDVLLTTICTHRELANSQVVFLTPNCFLL
jgi:hypothetical protein